MSKGKTFRVVGILFPMVLMVLYFTLSPLNILNADDFGNPRVQYERTYVLMPPNADIFWVESVLNATWDTYRYTVGGSADDAGIGNLRQKRVIAINPSAWPDGNLESWFEMNYFGLNYAQISAQSPSNLNSNFQDLNLGEIPFIPAPRVIRQEQSDYFRRYILLPPTYNVDWAVAAARGTWDRARITIGNSADDAGIGNLSGRQVIAVNPQDWPDGNLAGWFDTHYSGVIFQSIIASSPNQLQIQLQNLPDP